MENNSNVDICQMLQNIRCQFAFLFRRGFRVASVLLVGPRSENWQIVLADGNYLIQFYGHEEKVGLALSNLELCTEVGFFELQDLIHLMEREGNVSHVPESPPSDSPHELASIAAWLEEYMDDVWVLMEKIRLLVSNNKVRAMGQTHCPDFYLLRREAGYSFTSPSMTSSPLLFGADGPPGVSG